MNSVLPRSTACSIALICAGSVLSSMWKRGQPACRPNVSPNTSGPRLDPPIPSSTTSVNPRCFTSSAKAMQPVNIGQFLLHNVQPAEPFVLVRPGPQRLIAGPKPPNAPARAPNLHLRVESGLHLRGARPDFQSGAIAVQKCAPAPRDGAEQLVERIRELLHALLDQFFRDLLQRDAVLSSSASIARAPRYVLLDGIGRHLTVIAECIHRRRRDGVHGVAADERLDIHRVLVGRVFGAGGRPEQALRLRARRGQTLPARSGEQRLVASVGEFGVGDCRLAAQSIRQPFVAELVQPLVDRNVDAADEDAGDAADLGDVAAGPLQILKPGNIGFDHLFVDRSQKTAA